jgi:hypothetical protein
MKELTEGVRALHQRVEQLDEQLHEHRGLADLREKLGAAAIAQAENTRALLRKMIVVQIVGLVLWTPVVAYGAVWMHERVRNTCLPTVLLVDYLNGDEHPVPGVEPWYCGIFPGTNHPLRD